MQFAVLFKQYRAPIICIVVIVVLQWLARYTGFVQGVYMPYVYVPVTTALHIILGWLPISVGDVCYCAVFFYVLYFLYKCFRYMYSNIITKQILLSILHNIITLLLYGYTVFYLLWGITYTSKSIVLELKLPVAKYTTANVVSTLQAVAAKLNTYSLAIDKDNKQTLTTITSDIKQGYAVIANTYPQLAYTYKSIKPSFYSWAMNYAGFLGYYNPFTAEAQVNTSIPNFLIPAIAAHEMAHQLGYAKEDEANFVGYLAAKHGNVYSKYATYFDIFQYLITDLSYRDTAALKQVLLTIHPTVQYHLQVWKQYRLLHQGTLNDAASWTYSQYLKLHNMPNGVDTYNEVIGILIAYTKVVGLQGL